MENDKVANKLKICLIIPSLRNGGSERVISELANAWAKKELDVSLILLTNQEQFYDIDSRVDVISPLRTYKNNILSKTLFKLWTFYYIRKTCIAIKPNSILSFCEKYNNIVLLSLLGTKTNVYVSDRNSPYWNIGSFHKYLRNILYRSASGIIAQTSVAKKVLSKTTKNKNIKVIPNPLREIKVSKKSKEHKKKIILNVGRNVAQKNQLELIEIFSKCPHEDWILKILGNGPLKDDLIAKVKELGIENHVEILDFQKDVDSFYSEATIFAFSSLFEGFPNALNEAMAHGLTCIAYDCPTGPNDIIQNEENGVLIPFKNQECFQQKLTELMQSDNLLTKYSYNAKEVKEKYSLAEITKDYLHFILNNEVIN